MRRLVWVIALLLVLGGSVDSAQAKPNLKDCLKRGDVQLGRRRVDAAIISYTRAIELDPSFAEAYVRRAMALLSKGSLNMAIQDFETAKKIDSRVAVDSHDIAESYSNRGYIEMDDLRIEGAIEDLSKAIEFHRAADYFYRRGQARLINEDLARAIVDFDQALSLNPQNELLVSMIYANRGYALLLQGRENDGKRDFEKCFKSNSGQRVLIELDLHIIEAQIREMRRRRGEGHRNVIRSARVPIESAVDYLTIG